MSVNPRERGLCPEHKPLVDALLAYYDMEGLVRLAGRLPFDAPAANALCPHVYGGLAKERFLKWLGGRVVLVKDFAGSDREVMPESAEGLPEETPRRWGRWLRKPEQAASYCAAASQRTTAKVLTRMTELAEEKLALLRELLALVEEAKDVPLLASAIKGDLNPRGLDALLGKEDT